ncbi:MAG: ATP-binding protein [Saprospiraceae bacterium]|nr:ATP-binding protein [Saprospiraceae bacterium]
MKSKITICITGPESSGKTTLASTLSAFFRWPMVSEYARQHLSSGGVVLTGTDLVKLAHHQIYSENQALQTVSDGIICDTDMVVLKIWCLEKFKRTPIALDALCNHHRYGMTLLCKPDLAWHPDPLRENPMDRDRLFNRYLLEVQNLQLNCKIIEGHGKQRALQAIKIIEEYLKHH